MLNVNRYLKYIVCLIILMPINSIMASDKNIYKAGSVLTKKGGKISNKLLTKRPSDKQYSLASSTEKTNKPILLDVMFNSVPADMEKRLKSADFDVLALSEKYKRGSIVMGPTASLSELATWSEVKYINKELGRVKKSGAATSRAPEALKSNLITANPHNLSGAGQVVGILSDSFSHTSGMRDADTTPAKCIKGTLENSKSQDSGDLPAVIDIRKDDANSCSAADNETGGSDEGAAMAELVHDIAPGTAIAFSTVGESILSFALAIEDMCTPASEGGAGATVVVDDIIFLSQLMYQDDIVSQAARACVESGIPYFSAAGNNGSDAYQMEYNDISPSINRSPDSGVVSGNDFHKWNDDFFGQAYLKITVPAGSSFSAILQWNQPALSNPTNIVNIPKIDLDLFLLSNEEAPDTNGSNVLSIGIEDQADLLSSADPIESVDYENTELFSKTVYLAIDHWSGNKENIPQDDGTALEFRLVFFIKGQVGFPENIKPTASTMYGHSNAEGIISVAAVPWYETDAFYKAGGPTLEVDPEYFTAQGGRLNKYFSDDGSFNKRSVVVPTLASVDGNNTTFFGDNFGGSNFFGEDDGQPNFFGTSAAAPNAAAVAALLLEQELKTPEALKQVLTCSAQDVKGERAEVGFDNVTGVGLVDAARALDEMLQPSQSSRLIPLADRTVAARTVVNLNLLLEDSSRLVASSEWQHKSGFDITSMIEATPSGYSFVAPSAGFQTQLDVKIYDQCGFEYTDTINITVDGLPTANFQVDGERLKGETIILDASGSSDVEGPLTYQWSNVAPSNVTIENSTSAKASFLVESIGSHSIELTVTDSLGQKDSVSFGIYIPAAPFVAASSSSGGGGALLYFGVILFLLSGMNFRTRHKSF